MIYQRLSLIKIITSQFIINSYQKCIKNSVFLSIFDVFCNVFDVFLAKIYEKQTKTEAIFDIFAHEFFLYMSILIIFERIFYIKSFFKDA